MNLGPGSKRGLGSRAVYAQAPRGRRPAAFSCPIGHWPLALGPSAPLPHGPRAAHRSGSAQAEFESADRGRRRACPHRGRAGLGCPAGSTLVLGRAWSPAAHGLAPGWIDPTGVHSGPHLRRRRQRPGPVLGSGDGGRRRERAPDRSDDVLQARALDIGRHHDGSIAEHVPQESHADDEERGQ